VLTALLQKLKGLDSMSKKDSKDKKVLQEINFDAFNEDASTMTVTIPQQTIFGIHNTDTITVNTGFEPALTQGTEFKFSNSDEVVTVNLNEELQGDFFTDTKWETTTVSDGTITLTLPTKDTDDE